CSQLRSWRSSVRPGYRASPRPKSRSWSTARRRRSERTIAMLHMPQAAAGPAADDGWRRRLVGAGMALLPSALVGWTGWWVLAVSVVVLVILLFGRGRRVVRKRWDVAAIAAALLAGIVGVSGAALAIATMGTVPPYDSRVVLGWT